jgi:hypothetical protein
VELELGQVRERLQERFLSQVLGRVPVMRKMIEPAIQPVPVTLDQHGKRLPIALLSAQDQDVLLIHRVGEFFEKSHSDVPFQGLRSSFKVLRNKSALNLPVCTYQQAKACRRSLDFFAQCILPLAGRHVCKKFRGRGFSARMMGHGSVGEEANYD